MAVGRILGSSLEVFMLAPNVGSFEVITAFLLLIGTVVSFYLYFRSPGDD